MSEDQIWNYSRSKPVAKRFDVALGQLYCTPSNYQPPTVFNCLIMFLADVFTKAIDFMKFSLTLCFFDPINHCKCHSHLDLQFSRQHLRALPEAVSVRTIAEHSSLNLSAEHNLRRSIDPPANCKLSGSEIIVSTQISAVHKSGHSLQNPFIFVNRRIRRFRRRNRSIRS